MKILATLTRKRIVGDSRSTPGERAGRLYDAGANCAQAVLQATCSDVSEEIMRMADVFGGGIDDSKCLCGAVTGGAMSLSLQGKGDHAGRLVEAFRQRYRTTCCKGLTAPYRWLSREHVECCRRLTEETADLVQHLLDAPHLSRKK